METPGQADDRGATIYGKLLEIRSQVDGVCEGWGRGLAGDGGCRGDHKGWWRQSSVCHLRWEVPASAKRLAAERPERVLLRLEHQKWWNIPTVHHTVWHCSEKTSRTASWPSGSGEGLHASAKAEARCEPGEHGLVGDSRQDGDERSDREGQGYIPGREGSFKKTGCLRGSGRSWWEEGVCRALRPGGNSGGSSGGDHGPASE